MPLFPAHKSLPGLLRDFRNNLEERAGITNFDRDSKARSIMDTLSVDSLEHRNKMIESFEANNLTTAPAGQLEKLGVGMGEDPLPMTFASTTPSELNLAYYVESGTFGSINNGNPISIPAGTSITSTSRNNELGKIVEYKTTEDVLLPADSALEYIGAKAVVSGAISNVGAHVLRSHSFTNYAQSSLGSLKVINFFPILNGREVESVDRYRARLANKYNSLLQLNDSKIKLASISVPGVLGVSVVPGYFGIGTTAVIVLGPENQTSPSVVESVQYRLNELVGPGKVLRAIPATQALLDMDIELKPNRELTSPEVSRMKTLVRRTLTSYLGGLPLGASVEINGLLEEIRVALRGLAGVVKKANRPAIFKHVYVRKGYANGEVSERRELIQPYLDLDQDEFVVLGELNISIVGNYE